MKSHNIYTELQIFEKTTKSFLKDLSKQKILKVQDNRYTEVDKQEFLEFWNSYVSFFKRFHKVIRKSHYRTFIFFVNYDKLILRRYLLISYFNLLVEIIDKFGEHEEFLRIFLDENIKYSYGKIAKFIYKPFYIGLLNTPSSIIQLNGPAVSKKYRSLMGIEKKVIGNGMKIITDYKNIAFYLKRRLLKVLFTISKHSGKVIAVTKFSNRTKGLISKKSLKLYLEVAKPGDIFLTRGNWNASNITIPGFWKHMSMYIGTGEYLMKNYGKDYSFVNDLEKKKHYIIEATGAGVLIVQIEDFVAHNDYLAISRTNFSKSKIIASIGKAFSYYGVGYDHIFNFYSEKSVVCSELVLKSYGARDSDDSSIELHLEKIGVSLTYPPNNFVGEVFNEQSGLNFVMFIDSIEKTGENFISTKKQFKKSGERSRFSFMLK